jgi:trk system potassium uptake protein TrkA
MLSDEGHAVVVMDYDQHALARLTGRFKGERVVGIGFDRDTLIKAGIEEADAFAATSSSDNANIVSARIAREVFQVPRVVARLYDPRRAEIYRRLGLQTISSTTWGAERIRELLTHAELDPVLGFGNGEVSLLAIEIPPHLVGRRVKDLNIPGEIMVAAIARQEQAFIPHSGTEFSARDLVYLTVLASALEQAKQLLGLI